ncbi:MAG: chemotaxis protein CheW [Aphanothece sp. CMT-3BRIN-NPC111]|jgi:positive phototaxis protein PixI|nr:chemotaxis protein CheW [Aphanothece sp. CMT-3BRIN-NPC111]
MFALEPPNSANSPQSSEQKFLSFKLGLKDTALLPLECVTELFQVSVADILPVPQVPSCVLGVYNWREEMLWLVDLNALTGFPPLIQEDISLLTLMALVVQAQGQFIGLVVQQVKDIELLDTKKLKAPEAGLFNPELLPFLQGYFIGANNEILKTIDAKAILEASLWHPPTNSF